MKILAGTDKGRNLKRPKTSLVRPLTQRIKKSVFDIIGARIIGAKVLDLFAGSGSFSIEALSRGAEFITIVENNEQVVSLIKENIELIRAEKKVDILKMNIERAIKIFNEQNVQFDIVFCDPPFKYEWNVETLETLSKLLSKESLLIIRHHSRYVLPKTNTLLEKRTGKYGDSIVKWYIKI